MNTSPSKNTCLYKLCVIVLATSLNVGVKSENDFEYCPEGWTYYGPTNKCMKYVQASKNHAEVSDSCKEQHGFLVEPTSINETKFMCDVVADGDHSYIYVGIKKKPGNHFVYERFSTPVDTNIMDWAVGQPANLVCHCVVIDKNCNWHDASCGFTANYVCELIDVNSCKANNGDCSDKCVPTGFRTNNCVATCMINNGGCAEICQENGTNVVCSCHTGNKIVNITQCTNVEEATCNINNGGCAEICEKKGNETVCSCNTGNKLVNITHCTKDQDYKPNSKVEAEGSLALPISLLFLVILLLIAGAGFFILKEKNKQESGSKKSIEKKTESISGGEEEEEPRQSEDVDNEIIFEDEEEINEEVNESQEELSVDLVE